MKHYEIEGLKFASNVYYELRLQRLNKRLEKITPFIIIAMFGFTAWLCQIMLATAESASNIVYYLN